MRNGWRGIPVRDVLYNDEKAGSRSWTGSSDVMLLLLHPIFWRDRERKDGILSIAPGSSN